MSSGYGPFDGTVTFPNLGWRKLDREPTEADRFLGGEPCDLVLQVTSEGWGNHSGITVEDRDGESVELPVLDWVVVGILESDVEAREELGVAPPYRRMVAIPYEEVRKVLRDRAERIEDAKRQVQEAERAAEQARAKLADLEREGVATG